MPQGTDGTAFLASAISGRSVAVHCCLRKDELGFSDGASIMVPAGLACLWPLIAAQATLIAVNSLDVDILRQLLGRSEATRRYLYLEVIRGCRSVRDRLPSAYEALPEMRSAAPLSESPGESLEMAKGARALPNPPHYFGTIKPFSVLQRTVRTEGLIAAARGPFHAKNSHREPTEQSAILRLLQNPLSAGNVLSDLLNDILGAGISQRHTRFDAAAEAGAEMPVGRIERSLRRGVNAVLAKLPVERPALDPLTGSAALLYPEWDAFQNVYRRNWVVVETVEAWRPDSTQIGGNELRPPAGELRRQLADLGLDHQLHRRQSDGADLDMMSLMDAAIDLATGHSPPNLNVYRASRRTRRDLAVVIVLDISGSTGEADGVAISVFKKQIELAYRLGRTFADLGDTLSMFGFHSWGRKLVRAVRLKSAEERWSGRVAERMGRLEPIGYTRTGTAIRHGARLLREDLRLPNRLLVLITDGIAYDQDYEQHYGEGDTRKALQEAKAGGIACVCLSVGSTTATAKLVDVYGAANILAVDDVREVTGRIRAVCQAALASVSRRRLPVRGSPRGWPAPSFRPPR